MRLKKLAVSMALVGCSHLAWGQNSQQSTNAKQLQAINHQIDNMQAKIKDLKGQVHHLKNKLKQQKQQKQHAQHHQSGTKHKHSKNNASTSHSHIAHPKQSHYYHQAIKTFNSVSLGEYTGVPNYFDGRKLVVNAPSILKDYKLLKRRQSEFNYYQKHDLNYASRPRMIISGEIAGNMQYKRDYQNDSASDINLSAAAIDTYIEATPWISGLIDISYEDSDSQTSANRVNNANIVLDQAFVTIGNLNKTDLYGSVGQLDIPFGRFSSSMISDPLTEFVGKIKTRAASLGYRTGKPNQPFGSVFVYRGAANNDKRVDDVGADAGYILQTHGVKAALGGSFVNNIADAKGFQGTGLSNPHFEGFEDNESLQHRVPGGDIYGRLSMDPITFLGEYVTALRHFDSQNLTFDGEGAQPAAWHAEATYGFHIGQHSSSLSIGYGGSRQALGLNIPRTRYSTALQIALMRHTLLTFEYRHDINYGDSDTATGQGQQAYNADNLSGESDAVTAELAMYF